MRRRQGDIGIEGALGRPARELERAEGKGRALQLCTDQEGGCGGPDADRLERAPPGDVEPASQPSGRRVRVGGHARLPDVHRFEVAVVGIGESDAMDDGQLAALPQGVEAGQGGMQSEPVPQWQHAVRRQRQRAAPSLVVRIADRDDGIEPVVTAVERDENEPPTDVAHQLAAWVGPTTEQCIPSRWPERRPERACRSGAAGDSEERSSAEPAPGSWRGGGFPRRGCRRRSENRHWEGEAVGVQGLHGVPQLVRYSGAVRARTASRRGSPPARDRAAAVGLDHEGTDSTSASASGRAAGAASAMGDRST